MSELAIILVFALAWYFEDLRVENHWLEYPLRLANLPTALFLSIMIYLIVP